MSPQVRQLDATISSLKQHKQSNSNLLKALEEENAYLEQENASLKEELGAQRELAKVRSQCVKMFWDKEAGCNPRRNLQLKKITTLGSFMSEGLKQSTDKEE